MSNILLVEDSPQVARSVKKELEGGYLHKVAVAASLAEARKALETGKDGFSLAIVDCKLPDAPEGEAVAFVASLDIPVLAMTLSYDGVMRGKILSAGVVDYVLKRRPEFVKTVALEADRILNRNGGKVLVVDPRPESRAKTRRLLEAARFSVLEAGGEDEAMEVLSHNPDAKAALVEAELPNGDGFQLVGRIRTIYSWHALPVIGMSSHGEVSPVFLKNGANDFLVHPFQREELYSRLSLNIELAEQFLALRRAHHTDFLTQLPNRNHFFELAQKLYENSRRDNIGVTVALLDIDRFREVNGKHGHKAGDAVLKQLAGIFRTGIRKSDMVCRFGGEEFCFMMTNVSEEWMHTTFEKLRKKVEDSPIQYMGKPCKVTVSIGATSRLGKTLEEMVRRADELLHQAKTGGRNRTVIDAPAPAAKRKKQV
ncbi:MAG: diguanylate cyclase [Nitrospinae bacterium]|nr:diguanylate cyclase [Nitrospinota bacterium]